MSVALLRATMQETYVSEAVLTAYLPHFSEAMRAANINTVRRAAAWCSQLGHESGGLRLMLEGKPNGAVWNADRERYKGRGPIQLTHLENYRAFGIWCKAQGYVTDSEMFVSNPALVEQPKWGFLASSWYWLNGGPRPGQINAYADAGDILAVSRCVNGWVENKVPNGYDDRRQRWDRCLAIGESLLSLTDSTSPVEDNDMAVWTGDPTWLEDVLRPALGDRLKTLSGWQNRGHGDFKDIRGVMVHHTGNAKETAQSIANGRSDLAGPLSNIHIAPDGTVTIVAVGIAWHAGAGSLSWLPTNNANAHLIGIECAWPTIRSDGSYDSAEKWPDAQIISMRDTCAALAQRLDVPVSRIIGHKEWAGASQGKWDPGNLDMNWFRDEVQKDIDGFVFPGEQPEVEQPGATLPPDYAKETWDQLRIEWKQLGNRTLVDAVATIGAKLGIDGFYDPKSVK